MPRRPGRRALVVTCAVLAGSTVACGGGDEAASCGPITVEPQDPNQGHLLAGAQSPTFRTDPPTSGPHIAGLVVTGEMDRTPTGLEQVSTLETGAVIIQYRDADDRAALRGLAGDHVVVAPAPDLDSAVVATGWVRSMRCDGVDLDALEHFVDTVGGEYDAHSEGTGASTTTGG